MLRQTMELVMNTLGDFSALSSAPSEDHIDIEEEPIPPPSEPPPSVISSPVSDTIIHPPAQASVPVEDIPPPIEPPSPAKLLPQDQPTSSKAPASLKRTDSSSKLTRTFSTLRVRPGIALDQLTYPGKRYGKGKCQTSKKKVHCSRTTYNRAVLCKISRTMSCGILQTDDE